MIHYAPIQEGEQEEYSFTTMGPRGGLVFRQPLKNILGIDAALVLGGSGHYGNANKQSSKITGVNIFGGSFQAFLAKRFGNWEVGMGYYGSLNSVKWKVQSTASTEEGNTDDSTGNSNQQNNTTTDTTNSQQVCQTNSATQRCFYASSGLGLSVLWDVMPNVGMGVNSEVTWDGEFSPFVSGTANLVVSFR